jgi:hypothetical protein
MNSQQTLYNEKVTNFLDYKIKIRLKSKTTNSMGSTKVQAMYKGSKMANVYGMQIDP